jgi:hypothetical protein
MLFDPKWKAKKTAKSLPQIYNEAADAIRERGHSRGELRDKDGSMCVWGAINLVAEGDQFAVGGESSTRLAPLSKIVGKHVITWNNEEGRTKRQVIGLLRKAARRCPQETTHD